MKRAAPPILALLTLVPIALLLGAPSARADNVAVVASLPSSAWSGAAVWDGAGHAYVFGGFDGGGNASAKSRAIERFDATTGNTATVAMLPTAVARTSAVWDGAGHAFIFGGSTPTSGCGGTQQIVRFTPATGAVDVMMATLPGPREATAAVWDGGGHAYILGGDDAACGRNAQILRYTPSNDTLDVMPYALPTPTSSMAAVWTSGGDILALGGYSTDGPMTLITRITPANRTLRGAGQLARPLWTQGAATDGTTTFVFGGQGQNGVVSEIERLPNDGSAPATILATHLPSARGGLAAVWDGALSAYVVGGYQNTDVLRYATDLVPGAPTGLVAINGLHRVDLNWTAPAPNGGSPIAGYAIYRHLIGDNETLYRTIGPVLAFADVNVTDHGNYLYRVAAQNAVGEGARSSVANAIVDTPPSMPTALSAVGSPRQIDLSWALPQHEDIRWLYLYRGTTAGSETFYRNLTLTNSFSDGGLAPGATYSYRVSASNNIGEGPLSASATARVPTAPYLPAALAATAAPHRIDLVWSEPDTDGGMPVTRYDVYRGTASGSETGISILGDVRSFEDVNITDGTTYYYKVTATNAVGEGPASMEVVRRAPATPSQPTGQSIAAGPRAGQVTLHWSAPSDDGGLPVIQYRVERFDATAHAWALVSTVNANASSLGFVDAGRPREDQQYRVEAENAVGIGRATPFATVRPWAAPGAPDGVSATPTAKPGEVLVAWNAPSDDGGLAINDFVISRAQNGTSDYVVVATFPGSLSGSIFDENVPSQLYDYVVRARNLPGDVSVPSRIATAAPLHVGVAADGNGRNGGTLRVVGPCRATSACRDAVDADAGAWWSTQGHALSSDKGLGAGATDATGSVGGRPTGRFALNVTLPPPPKPPACGAACGPGDVIDFANKAVDWATQISSGATVVVADRPVVGGGR